ncbi:MAG: hypothetical protein RL681_521 [Candidatus Parcubacteria bacterium]
MLTGIWEFIFKDLGAAALWDVLKKLVAERAADGFKKSFEEQRAALLAYILTLTDREASKNLLAWHKKRQQQVPPYTYGDENRFVKLLTKLFTALEKPEQKKVRDKVFSKLGRMSESDFNLALDFLEHDFLKQLYKKVVAAVKNTTPGAMKAVMLTTIITYVAAKWAAKKAVEKAKAAPGAVDKHVAKKTRELTRWLDRKTKPPSVTLRGRSFSTGTLVGLGLFLASIVTVLCWAIAR